MPSRSDMLRRATLLTTTVVLGSLVAGGLWLTGSESGLQTAAQLAGSASGGQLQIEQASGRLLGPLAIGMLRWETPDLQIRAEQIELDWSPGALLQGRLQIAELRASLIHIISAPSSQPTPPPTDLTLPAAVDIEKLTISRVEYGSVLATGEISGRLGSDGKAHRLSDFKAELAGTTLNGEATLGGLAPLPLTARLDVSSQLDQRPLALSLSATGPLERIAISAIAQQGIEGQANVVLTPFATASFSTAQIALDNIDPAAWQAGAPAARLSLRADLGPKGDGVAGNFTLNNSQPGPLDRQRLPLDKLSGRLDWQGESAKLEALQAALAGNGELTGHGQWQAGTLNLELTAKQLDAARIVSTLRSTRLKGTISTALNAERQAVKLDLKDEKFSIQAEASHASATVTLPKLEITAGTARLAASGELSLASPMSFKADGELARFDPSRFAKVPAAQINARFKTQGKLEPRPVIDGQFELQDSQLAGQPFAGHGQLSIDWPRVPKADIRLSAGTNHLTAKGAYGNPGDVLAIKLDAPQLAPYGLEGGISGHFSLAGSGPQTKLSGQLQAARLGRVGLGRLSGLALKLEAGGEASSPLLIDLSIAQLTTPDQPALAKAVLLRGEGSNQSHRLRASADLFGKNQLTLAAAGGLDKIGAGAQWLGQLLEARIKGEDKARNLQLTAPAPLKLGADGWSLGPAKLGGDPLDWQATLQAAADRQKMHASLNAKGTRVGLIEAELDAGMLGAWSLNGAAPWQGKLKMAIADLGWLAELIGDGWQSEGRFNGELKLAGTPDHPVSSGRFRGEKLALRLPEQALNLVNGDLAVDLDDNLLRVRQLTFDSLLQPLPRPLRLAGKEEIASLTQRPGRLEISGEMRVDRSKGADNAFLDIHLDRLGAFQLPDQWVAVSGDGRLTLKGDTLGAKGKLLVDAGYWQLAPSGAPRLSDDVIIKRPGNEQPATSLRPKLDLDISTDLGKNFLFKGAGLSSRLVGDLRLRASGRDLPRATGSIRARDGRFDAYGQQLAIERGILTFQGLLDNPALDVRAVRKGLSVEAGVQISGTVQRPLVKLISDPDLPDAEKLAWLVLGHGPESMGAGDATVLLGAAGGLLGSSSGNLVQQLKKTFGIDEFGVRQGEIGGSGSRQPTSRVAGSTVDTTAATGNQIFSVGKRLSSNALLSYEQSMGRAESIVKLTVNLTRQVSIIGRAGSDNALDIFYTLTFGRAQRRPPPP
ncbi:MAG: translocation/assembly module TamB domain-containing protein [Azonexus sp.]|nr:translocation/assembly module TamB domain-containing protein [Azonexus sp.]